MNPSTEAARPEGLNKDPEYQLESPFLDRYEPEKAEEGGSVPAAESSIWQELESPFVSHLEMETHEGEDPQAKLYAQLLSELQDEEFGEAINNLVQEAAAVYEGQLSQNFGDSEVQRAAAEDAVREYLEPLVQETEALLETIGQAFSGHDISTMSEDELDEFFDQFEPTRSDLSPAFEDFLKGVKNKSKKSGKGISSLFKKGLKIATAIGTGGMSLVLGKLKKFARPLLMRVLKTSVGKLPPKLRPAATGLAKKFASAGEGEAAYEYESTQTETTGSEFEDIQKEFDVQVVNSLVADSLEESEAAVTEYQGGPEEVGVNEYDVLQESRAKFAEQISRAQDAEDVKPALEEFIPAILAALRIGIRIIGRPRVVNFLSGLVAKLIGRFVGKDLAQTLSRAIVDAGLRIMSMETSEQTETRVGGNAIAATVEETIERIAALPETVFEDFELLEAYTLEAFEQAAASNFPPEMIKPELREAATNGTWVLMPVNGKRKFYKKYTVIFEKTVTPQVAANIKTFDGQSLMTVLRDLFNLDPTKDIKAKIHLYEAIPGTWLSRISLFEKNVPGMGSAAAGAWSQIHPLTPEAAAALLGEPGLGREVPARFLQDRNLIQVGQRFYYLEIEGARPILSPMLKPRRSSRVLVRVDCPKNQIRVALFLGERDAQGVSAKLRQNSPWSAVARAFTSLLSSIRRNFSLRRNVRIIHEAVTMEDYAGLVGVAARGLSGLSGLASSVGGAVGRAFGRVAGSAGRGTGAGVLPQALTSVIADKLMEWCLKKIGEYLKERKTEFIKATENPADGVTILITFANPGLLPLVCRAMRGEPISLLPSLIPRGLPGALVRIYPGFRRA